MTTFISLAAPHVIIKYNNKDYKLSALTFKDFADYILWYQFTELRAAKIQTKDFPPELRNKILEETYQKCINKRYIDAEGKPHHLSWELPEIQESLNTIEGIAYQLYLSLRREQPEVTEEIADEIVTLQTYSEILGKILIVQGLEPDKDKDKESSEGEAKSLNL